MSFRIRFDAKGWKTPVILNYSSRGEALESWDQYVEDAIPGDKLQLIDVDNGRIMSEYTPVDFNKGELM